MKTDSRMHFVNQVATTIKENHAKTSESFIFGISGKWGEGKTYFLDLLEKELENKENGFQVIKINPWKFATDRVSFLRTFIKKIMELEGSKRSKLKSLRDFVNNNQKLKRLYFDVSEKKIHPGWFTFIILTLVTACICIYFGFISVSSVLSLSIVWKWILGVITIPLVISVIQQMVTSQQSNKSISTIDEFDTLLSDELESNQKRKLIVFIDDLDRVSPQVAREVLDNLRTFFDRQHISFIVTGDHSVLERHVGRELLPDEESPAALEEGRRFMKKIFNVYWRLPVPIETELNNFLEIKFLEHQVDLNTIFNKEQQLVLQTYFARYFERNFRHIIRFLEMVIFTFRIIQSKCEVSDPDEKKYLEELLANPLLVVRTLMIQEHCTPLFEHILQSSEILLELERAVELKNNSRIDQILKDQSLSPAQEKFIKRFFYEEPRFFKHSSLQVSNLQPFLYLAADASFGDSRGPSQEDFISILDSGNPEGIKNSLVSSGDERLQTAANAFITRYNSGSPDEKGSLARTLVSGLSSIPESHAAHNVFASKLEDVDLSFIRNLGTGNRVEYYRIFWTWLDKVKMQTGQVSKYKDKFPYVQAADFENVSATFKDMEIGKFSTEIIASWFAGSYPNEIHSSVDHIYPLLKSLDKEIAEREISKVRDAVVTNLIGDNNPERRIKRFEVLKLLTDAKDFIRDKVFEVLRNNKDSDLWNWAVNQDTDFWTRKDLYEAVIGDLNSGNYKQNFTPILNFTRDYARDYAQHLWTKAVTENLSKDLTDILGPTYTDESYRVIAPSEDNAKLIFARILEDVRKTSEVSEKIRLLDQLNNTRWLWSNLDKFPDKRLLGNLTGTSDASLKNVVDTMLREWGS